VCLQSLPPLHFLEILQHDGNDVDYKIIIGQKQRREKHSFCCETRVFFFWKILWTTGEERKYDLFRDVLRLLCWETTSHCRNIFLLGDNILLQKHLVGRQHLCLENFFQMATFSIKKYQNTSVATFIIFLEDPPLKRRMLALEAPFFYLGRDQFIFGPFLSKKWAET